MDPKLMSKGVFCGCGTPFTRVALITRARKDTHLAGQLPKNLGAYKTGTNAPVPNPAGVPPSGAGVGRLWRITDSLSGETKTPGHAQQPGAVGWGTGRLRRNCVPGEPRKCFAPTAEPCNTNCTSVKLVLR